jgi:hypothetical protein
VIGPVSIGAGTVVGGSSVVTEDLPPDMACAGIPAKPNGLGAAQAMARSTGRVLGGGGLRNPPSPSLARMLGGIRGASEDVLVYY